MSGLPNPQRSRFNSKIQTSTQLPLLISRCPLDCSLAIFSVPVSFHELFNTLQRLIGVPLPYAQSRPMPQQVAPTLPKSRNPEMNTLPSIYHLKHLRHITLIH